MMMYYKVPETFTLFNQQWQIRTAAKFELENDLGQCRPDQFEILVNTDQCEESLRHTLLHELVHCIEQKLHLELTERHVDLIALGLIDLLSNNPDLLTLFNKEHDEL